MSTLRKAQRQMLAERRAKEADTSLKAKVEEIARRAKEQEDQQAKVDAAVAHLLKKEDPHE